MGYLANEPIMLEARGVPVDVLAVSDVSHLVGPGLVTSEAVLAGHNNLARNVVAALRRGLKKTIDDPDHAFQAALKFMPDLQGAENLRLQRMVLRRAIELWKSSGELGRCDEERWRQSQEVLYRAKMISKKLPPAEFFTNELIDAALRLP
jgi:NitT/TauT family transport system substrate-binding protein